MNACSTPIVHGQPNKITVIFGRRISKHYRGKLQTEIEDMQKRSQLDRLYHRVLNELDALVQAVDLKAA